MQYLISGGTGSFGQAFAQRLLEDGKASRIVIYSRDEMKQDAMAQQFNHDSRLRFFIGDVRDRDRLELAARGIDVIVHAAALKIVPAAEYNPTECVRTNIGGAENVMQVALRSDTVKKVIALSTDKAVNPINLYCATKLAAEKIMLAANNLAGKDGCRFSVCRYGNVISSRGSVIPLFKRQVEQGIPLTITDPRMTRSIITMNDVVGLAGHAINIMNGRAIFVPTIPSMNIVDIALAVDTRPGIPRTSFIGIRPGEKLHETLLTEHEDPDGKGYSSDTNDRWMTVEQLRALI